MSGPQFWGNVAQWISGVGTTIAVGFTAYALFMRHRDLRALEFDRNYRQCRRHLQVFWTEFHKRWHHYRNGRTELPPAVTEFFALVGPPPLVPVLRDWSKSMQGRLSPAQEHAWTLVHGIYPSSPSQNADEAWEGSSITPPEAAKSFHEARGELAWFWNSEGIGVHRSHLRANHYDDRDLLIALSWLEVALTQRTRAAGPGKTRLFKLAADASRNWHCAV